MKDWDKKIYIYRIAIILLVVSLLLILCVDNFFYIVKVFSPEKIKLNENITLQTPDIWLMKKENKTVWIRNKQGEVLFTVQYDERLKKVNKQELLNKLRRNSLYVKKTKVNNFEVWEFVLNNNYGKDSDSVINYLIFPIGLKIEYFGRVSDKNANLKLLIRYINKKGKH